MILPNIGPGMASGAILAFGVSFNEIAMLQMLAGDRFETVPLYTLNLLKSTDPDFNVLAVMTTVSFAITLLLSIAVVYFNRPRRPCWKSRPQAKLADAPHERLDVG